jgi:F-type H+-transporting ATPase subunit delta
MATAAAKRYTQAVFDIAREQGTFDQWQRDLDKLGALTSDPQASVLLASPKISEENKLALITEQLKGSQPEALNLARLLLQRGRLPIAAEMADTFRELALAELGIVVADVTTAKPIDKATEAAIKLQLSKLVGKQVEIRTHVDETIIGGIIARIGDQLIDGSVSNQLRRLRTQLGAGV